MKTATQDRANATYLLPIIRSVGREMKDRSRAIAFLEERVSALEPTSRVHVDDLGNLRAELSIQRRELRRCQAELTRLGCSLDPSSPMRILWSRGPAHTERALQLDDTQFLRAPADIPA